MKKEWENYVEETKPVDYELNSKHQTPEQQPSNIPTVGSFLPAFEGNLFSNKFPKLGNANTDQIYTRERSHMCLVMLNNSWNSKSNLKS